MLLVSPNRFLVSVNQRHQEREEPLLSVRPVSSFMQFPRPSITRASSQHAHSERKKRSSWIIFLNQNVYKLIPIHSVKVSTAFSRPSTERCTMLIGIGKDLLVHVLEGNIHGNQNVFLPRAWYGFVLGVV
ncbi:hypothetical protein VNO80_13017 [Phaseolus coccineus]|uniref:Uncharacterized protein n=1 Tax=Phaseolus coccineus TaxID=3886 RepID=A0AAN9N0D4_PHACN